jgi:hypothetical protein
MPAVGQGTKPVKVKVRPAAKAPAKAKPKVSQAPVQSPDSRDNNQTARAPKPVTHPSPDAGDVTGRSPQQKLHDSGYAQDVQDAAAGRNPTLAKELGLHPRKPKAKVKTGHGPGHVLATINPSALVHAVANVDAGGSMPVFSGIAHVGGRAVKDAEEMAVTLPSSVAHVVSTAVTHPEKLPGELAKPYEELAKHPIKTLSEHPLQTALMVAPAVRMPGRVLGKAARVTGKQTLERPAAVLPGTALKETRTGSRDAFVRGAQARADRKHPAPVVSVTDVQRRVDEFHDAQRQAANRAEAVAVRDAHRATKGQPKHVRVLAKQQAREQAREQAHEDSHVAFAKEFGANARPSTGAAEREFAHKARVAAVARVDAARSQVHAATVKHDRALANAKTARAARKRSPRLQALEGQRKVAQTDLARAHRAHGSARVEQARAEGAARVSEILPKTSEQLRGLRVKATEATRRVTSLERGAATSDRHPVALPEIGARDANGARAARAMAKIDQAIKRHEHDALRAADAGDETGFAAAEAAIKSARKRRVPYEKEARLAARISRAAAEADRGAGLHRDLATARAQLAAGKVRVAAEHRRISGVAPAQQVRLGRALQAAEEAPTRVRDARARVRDLDTQIAAEHQRLAGVPPAEHQALIDAIHNRGDAHAELAAAKARADAARAVHINVKQQSAAATLVSPSVKGRLFSHKADANRVAQRLNDQAVDLHPGSKLPLHTELRDPAAGGAPAAIIRGHATQPLEFTVRQVGEHYAVVPKVAAHRMYPSGGEHAPLSHASVGSSKSTGAKVMRVSRGAFTKAVLPLSFKWLAGQGVEAGIRSAVAGAGPFDVLRLRKVVKDLNARQAGAGDALLGRINGGNLGLTGAARDFGEGKTLAEEFAGTPLRGPAAAVTLAGRAVPLRAVRHGFAAYSSAVMNTVNGLIENTARHAMAGQAIKNMGLIDNHLIGLTDAAIKDAASGLRHTESQAALGRAVDRMYGRYQKFSPERRTLIMHWTPFLPWYLNVVTFLTKVLPVDHPVQAALLADINAAEQDWRKAHELSVNQPNHVPDFLLGGYPDGKGGFRRIAHYTPFGAGPDAVSATGGLVLPQFEGPILNALGVDWKGQPLTTGGTHGKPFTPTQKALRALVTAAEEQIPGVAQAGAISGVTPRYVDRDNPAYIKTPGQVLKGYLPTTATKGAASSSGTGSSVSGGVASHTPAVA